MSATDWTEAQPGPHRGTVVWRVDLAPGATDLARAGALLPDDEAARAGRFHRREDRERYVASHAALRVILGAALGVEPRAVAFAAGPHGKPELVGTGLHVNLSHSGARALVAVSARAPVGVDVEARRPMPDALRIARSQFAREESAALAALPPDAAEAAFFGLWTRKEALVKACGAGLTLPLTSFAVSLPPESPRLVRGHVAGIAGWTLRHLRPGAGTVGTVAVAAEGEPIALRGLPPDWSARAG